MPKKYRIAALAALVLVVLIGIALIVRRPPEVFVREITPTTTEIALSVVGRVRPADLVQVNTQNAGQVIELLADDGDRVSADTPLAVIRATVEQAQAQANLARERAARAEAVMARQNYDRTRMLADRGFAAPAALQNAEAALKAAEANVIAASAEVRAAAERTREFTLRAPMNGIILVRPIDNGQVVSAGETLFEIGSATASEIWAEVDETYADDLVAGLTARAALSGSEAIFPARVLEVSPRVDQATGGRQIKLAPDRGIELPAGRSVDVTVVIGERTDAIVIPRNAILDATADPRVLVVDKDNVAHSRKVTVLRWPSVNAVVESGLRAGDRIVLDPVSVREGQRVKPVIADGR